MIIPNKKPVILDVTIRDGGYLNDWYFDNQDIINMVTALSHIGIDIIEVGYLHSDTTKPIALQCSESYLKLLRSKLRPETKMAVMLRSDDGDNYLEMLEKTADHIDMIRMACTEEAFERELEMIANVKKFDIFTSFNFTSITSFTNDEILWMLDKVMAKDCVDMLYIADSRGTLQPDRAFEIFDLLGKIWGKPLGFHGHNNQGLAIENVKAALSAGVEFLDASIKGYSFGGGNTKLSDLLALLHDKRTDIQLGSVNLHDLIELDNSPEYAYLFKHSGRKNLEQGWVKMIWDRYGAESLNFIQQIPNNQLNKTLADIGFQSVVSSTN